MTGAHLCRACGLCCDGTFFSVGRLAPDELGRAPRLGLPLVPRDGGSDAFPQPCAQHRGTHCAIYDERPACCRRYRCRLLRDLEDERVSEEKARAHVARVRALASAIRRELPDELRHTSIFTACQSLDSASDAVDWRRDHAELLLDVGELVHLSRKRFGIRDGRDMVSD